MSIHKEGYTILSTLALLLVAINVALQFAAAQFPNMLLSVLVVSVIIFGFCVQFFRHPKRATANTNDNLVIAPADGKVVVIEEVDEPEFFKDKRIQISIFMSPLNVHVNRSPINGKVTYTKYHPGDYLVAWHPKSSTLNERFTSVITNASNNTHVLVRQIAGKVARKISNYLIDGQQIEQGQEFGFIKFGSRVDIFLPPNANIKVGLNDKVQGGISILASFE